MSNFLYCMNPLLKRLLRMSEDHHMPVILYDSKSDRAGVLMSLDYFDEHLNSEAFESNDFGPLAEAYEYEECDEPHESMPQSRDFLDEDDDEQGIEQTNEELALWKAKREEKEREEIEKTLEEELLENPPPDPFEEDMLHTPEWHQVTSIIEEDVVPPTAQETPKEPSYHPVINSGGSLSWTDWAFTGNSFTPIVENTSAMLTEDEEETADEPIFLEEPV